jgi:hypothetical protein
MTNRTTQDSPVKLCECGCGQPAPLAKKTNTLKNAVRGVPLRFIPGHYNQFLSNRNKTLAERLWEDVDRREEHECWEWQGNRTNKGYGRFNYLKKTYFTHRVAWELHNGTIPDGMVICHRCDNRSCCNPAHLFLGTQSENVADMIHKDRNARGKRNTNAKLVDSDIVAIRQLADAGVTVSSIAEQYGIAYQTVRRIVRRSGWKHVP